MLVKTLAQAGGAASIPAAPPLPPATANPAIMLLKKRRTPRFTATQAPPSTDKAPAQICAQFAQDPDNVLDMLIDQCSLKHDSALAKTLGVTPSVISRIRRQRPPIGPALLLRILEITDTSISDLQRRVAHHRSRTPI